MYNFKYFLFFLILTFSNKVYADIKNKIINKIIDTNSIEFDFTQSTNNNIEDGSCILLFVGKLKCLYNNKNKKLILNNEKLAIIQKRYDKIFYYPLSKSPFVDILNKEKLINIIKNGKINTDTTDRIKLTKYENERQIVTIFFKKKKLNLMGWETTDQFNNKIVFLIQITSINKSFKHEEFEIEASN